MRLLVPLLLLSPPALASWPSDVSISGMTEHGGRPVADPAVNAEAYRVVVRQLGMAVAQRALAPAQSTGVTGFEFTFETNAAFVSTRETGEPAPWSRMHPEEDPFPFLWAPGFTVRKGLPMGIDVGLTGSWIGLSRTGTFGAFGSVALVDGWEPWPDVALHFGYTGYVGNDELELGVFEFGGTISTDIMLGPVKKGVRTVAFSPIADASLLSVAAAPTVSQDVIDATGAVAFGRRTATPDVPPERAITMFQLRGGIQVHTARFMLRASGGYAFSAGASAQLAVGFKY